MNTEEETGLTCCLAENLILYQQLRVLLSHQRRRSHLDTCLVQGPNLAVIDIIFVCLVV
jgi:hypothetical protein